MSVIAEKRWSYVFFDDGKGWVITVLIGGVVEIDVSVRLTSEEINLIKSDVSYADHIAEEIKCNRDKFSAREISPPIWP